ncbi:regulatory protein RecX [Aliikangiella marina]|uniref:Regulatory protein RecX n=1 Tax=Aliikangiella marina TaxID=1712262 RepID=A0A545TH72_9GAMM|nr:regulatory protein RecX [Aliikangiella marina]TQV76580.1 regulatory protein RecX [Aliikangiella marina]
MNELSSDTPVLESLEFEKSLNKAIAYACRLLGVREYAQKMILKKLTDKGFDNKIALQTLEFLVDNGWQSDQRFCESFIRGRVAKGQGYRRIKFELAQKGIDEQLSRNGFEQLEIDWQEVCNSVAIKKIATIKDIRESKARLKVERFLQYRGFSNDQIRTAIDSQSKI